MKYLTHIRNLICAAGLVLLLYSFTSPPPGETAKVLTKRWEFIEMHLEGEAAMTANQLSQSRQTDYIQLNKNGSYDFMLFSELNSGKWSLMENNTRLLLDAGTDVSSIFQLVKVEDKELIISQLDRDTRKMIFMKFHAKL